ncbi:MAG: hypothetical protein ACM3VW_10930 [Bacteroidota bacterium]
MKRALVIGTLLLAVGAGWGMPFAGPFALNSGITFYLVNPEGQAFDLSVKIFQPWRKSVPTPTLLRVLDPQEKLVLRHEWPGETTEKPQPEELKVTVAGAGPGVYQVIVNGGYSVGWSQSTVEIKTTPGLDFGVFGHLDNLAGMKQQFADTYVYLPPGLKTLPVTVGGELTKLVLADEAGTAKLELSKVKKSGEVELPAGGEHVWRLQAEGPFYTINTQGYPIILCPTPESAKAIRASVDVMPDGTICFHKHQVAAWKLLQEYKKKPASAYNVPVVPLAKVEAAMLKEPGRNTLLFGHYGIMSALPALLAQQNLDPKSPWFGSIVTWKDKEGKERPSALADYDRGGEEAFASLNKNLAGLYWMRGEHNPYYHNPQLLNRVIVGALLDQMVMREGEYCNVSNTSYWGTQAFTLEHSQSGAFSLVYKDVPKDVQAVWHAGQQRLTDRMLYGTVGGCTNQWTILLTGLWRYYEGTGEEQYAKDIMRNVGWLENNVFQGQRPAGYMTEANGPDATYNGITGHSLSVIYHHTKDAALLESLRKCYNLFNHTITPEPDDKWLASSGYCHRTPGDWTSPQYGAGLGPMSAVLPEAGLRYPGHGAWAYYEPYTDEAGKAKAEEDLKKVMSYFGTDYFGSEGSNYARASGAFDIGFENWRIYQNKYVPGKLPVVAEDNFTRSFGDEFLCVRRPAYYAFLYSGTAYQEWQMGARPKDANEQYPSNDGLCVFWTPEFGVSLLTKNWGATRTNTLLVKTAAGEALWPYYIDTKSRYDTGAGTAVLTGKIRGTGLSYERAYRFGDEGVECTLTVTAAEAGQFAAVSECIPYPLEDIKPGMTVSLQGAAGKATGIVFADKGGKGHTVALEQPAAVELGKDETTDHYGGKHVYGRALIALPTDWAAGQTVVLKYRLLPRVGG